MPLLPFQHKPLYPLPNLERTPIPHIQIQQPSSSSHHISSFNVRTLQNQCPKLAHQVLLSTISAAIGLYLCIQRGLISTCNCDPSSVPLLCKERAPLDTRGGAVNFNKMAAVCWKAFFWIKNHVQRPVPLCFILFIGLSVLVSDIKYSFIGRLIHSYRRSSADNPMPIFRVEARNPTTNQSFHGEAF